MRKRLQELNEHASQVDESPSKTSHAANDAA